MNKVKSLLTIFTASVILLSGCTLKKMIKMAQEQQLTVTPSPLEMHGNKVEFDMSAMLPVKMLKKNTIYTVKAYYQYGDQKLDLGNIEFKAEDYPDATIQPKVTQKFSFDYKPEYRRGKVMVTGEAAKVTGKSLPLPNSMEVAEGVITTPELVMDEVTPAYAFHGYNNQEELIPTNVEFFFSKGSAKLSYKESKGDEGKKMGMFIADKKVTRTVNIYGHHSPEGKEAINTGLAEDRAKAIESFYRKEMKKYDYKDMADSIKFVLNPMTQDWKMFRDLVKSTSELDEGQKTQVLDIIDVKGADFVEQENKLQGLSFYKTIKNKLYPEVRTAKTEILSVKEKKTDAEISAIASQIVKGDTATADTLSVEELGYAATLTEDLKEKEGIYLELTKRAQTWESHNNLAALYIEQALVAANADKGGLIEKAQAQLEISVKKEESAENLANLASVKAMTGDYEGSKADAIKALEKNPKPELVKTIKSGLAPQFIRSGDYDQALKNLETSALTTTSKYNMGLTQLLTKDFDAAANNLVAASEDKENAYARYCAAIAAARTGDESTMAARLKNAIELDSDLRTRAIDDLEFVKYFESQSFKDAVK